MQCKLLLHSPNHQMILNEMIYLNWFYLQNANVLRKYFLNICINTYPVTIFLLFKIWILALQKIADGRLHNTTISTPFLDNDIENTSYKENRNDDTDERTSIVDCLRCEKYCTIQLPLAKVYGARKFLKYFIKLSTKYQN